MNKAVKHSLINIGTSKEKSIKEFGETILNTLGFKLKIKFNGDRNLDGMKSKVLDTSLAKRYGWQAKTKLEDAILKTYDDLKNNFRNIRR